MLTSSTIVYGRIIDPQTLMLDHTGGGVFCVQYRTCRKGNASIPVCFCPGLVLLNWPAFGSFVYNDRLADTA